MGAGNDAACGIPVCPPEAPSVIPGDAETGFPAHT